MWMVHIFQQNCYENSILPQISDLPLLPCGRKTGHISLRVIFAKIHNNSRYANIFWSSTASSTLCNTHWQVRDPLQWVPWHLWLQEQCPLYFRRWVTSALSYQPSFHISEQPLLKPTYTQLRPRPRPVPPSCSSLPPARASHQLPSGRFGTHLPNALQRPKINVDVFLNINNSKIDPQMR